jgi:hypothetical protein
MVTPPRIDGPKLIGEDEMKPGMALQVSIAISSPCTEYTIRRGRLLPKGHLFYEAYEIVSNEIVRGTASIPLRDTKWQVPSEAVRIGTQLFGIFNIDPPPGNNSGVQLRLF